MIIRIKLCVNIYIPYNCVITQTHNDLGNQFFLFSVSKYVLYIFEGYNTFYIVGLIMLDVFTELPQELAVNSV